jgi:DNA invertase Pin-like site-specific DNA recombinase
LLWQSREPRRSSGDHQDCRRLLSANKTVLFCQDFHAPAPLFSQQYIDSLGVFGEAIIGVLAAVAAQERIRISERTKAGLTRTRAQGTRLGRPVKAVDLGKVRKLRAAGMSLREIGRKLHVSPALVCLRLKKIASRQHWSALLKIAANKLSSGG